MQHKTLYAFLFLTCLTCCKSENKKYTIEGTVPSTKYDGEWIYLVPAEKTSSSHADSVKITNASFTFEGNKEQMSIIRTRPLLRLKLQELLLVTEPGTVKVIVDSVSSVHGTPQNDALQSWKVEKEKIMVGYMFIRKGLETVSGKDSLRWVVQKNMFIKREHINNQRILKEQDHNTVGTFVRKITGEANK